MKVVNEAVENAWMIRNDGKPFRMLQHVYGSKEEVEETLAAAEWLYDATNSQKTKTSIVDLISSWGYSLNPDGDIVETIHSAIDIRPYKFLTHEFIDKIANHIRDGAIQEDVMALNDHVVDELNQEFLRARYGGMYNSTVGNKEMVFRVSSVHFNWFNIIFSFVYDRKNSISSVTIVKDEEATGFDDVYSHRGHKMYQMPVSEFIELPGNPVVESLNESLTVKDKLSQGQSILESAGTNMNLRRLNERWFREKYNFFSKVQEM